MNNLFIEFYNNSNYKIWYEVGHKAELRCAFWAITPNLWNRNASEGAFAFTFEPKWHVTATPLYFLLKSHFLLFTFAT